MLKNCLPLILNLSFGKVLGTYLHYFIDIKGHEVEFSNFLIKKAVLGPTRNRYWFLDF
jgi:hypothetical protein